MEKEAQRFLEAEEIAHDLVRTLKQLQQEATSYRSATEELNAVRERLVEFVESMQQVATGTHEIIKTLMSIGAPEIMDRIGGMENTILQGLLSLSKGVGDLRTETADKVGVVERRVGEESSKLSRLIQGLAGQSVRKILQAEDKISQELAALAHAVNRLNVLVMATLACSVIALTIGVVSIFK